MEQELFTAKQIAKLLGTKPQFVYTATKTDGLKIDSKGCGVLLFSLDDVNEYLETKCVKEYVSEENPLLSMSDVADLLGIAYTTARKLFVTGVIDYVILGKNAKRVSKESLTKQLQKLGIPKEFGRLWKISDFTSRLHIGTATAYAHLKEYPSAIADIVNWKHIIDSETINFLTFNAKPITFGDLPNGKLLSVREYANAKSKRLGATYNKVRLGELDAVGVFGTIIRILVDD